MRIQTMVANWLVVALVGPVSVPAFAGVYADDMAKCLVKSTTTADRNVFVKWLFASMALHPEVESMAAISAAQRDELNKNAAALFEKLLTESCRTETELALKFEGPQTLQVAFQFFGQAAGRELMLSPRVAEGMAGLNKYMDREKLKALAPEGTVK